IAPPFEAIGLGELGADALAFAVAILLGVSAWRISRRRRAIARLALVITLVAAAGAVVLMLNGPEIKADKPVEVPIGFGLLLIWNGVGANVVVGVLTMRLEPQSIQVSAEAADAPLLGVAPQLPPYDPIVPPSPDLPMRTPSQIGTLAGFPMRASSPSKPTIA